MHHLQTPSKMLYVSDVLTEYALVTYKAQSKHIPGFVTLKFEYLKIHHGHQSIHRSSSLAF